MSDLIDREQVKEHLIKACPMVQKKYLKDIIDGIPSVNVPSAEKTGRWIEQDDEYNDTIYQCSVCGEEFVTIEGTPADNLWNYCPNCGARMED